jgi:hypothetical protein
MEKKPKLFRAESLDSFLTGVGILTSHQCNVTSRSFDAQLDLPQGTVHVRCSGPNLAKARNCRHSKNKESTLTLRDYAPYLHCYNILIQYYNINSLYIL